MTWRRVPPLFSSMQAFVACIYACLCMCVRVSILHMLKHMCVAMAPTTTATSKPICCVTMGTIISQREGKWDSKEEREGMGRVTTTTLSLSLSLILRVLTGAYLYSVSTSFEQTSPITSSELCFTYMKSPCVDLHTHTRWATDPQSFFTSTCSFLFVQPRWHLSESHMLVDSSGCFECAASVSAPLFWSELKQDHLVWIILDYFVHFISECCLFAEGFNVYFLLSIFLSVCVCETFCAAVLVRTLV